LSNGGMDLFIRSSLCDEDQANSKFIKAEPSQSKLQPNFSKENALISLDSLVRNEPFQSVVVTPRAKNPFSAPFLAEDRHATDALR
jgi:hypothetical protein